MLNVEATAVHLNSRELPRTLAPIAHDAGAGTLVRSDSALTMEERAIVIVLVTGDRQTWFIFPASRFPSSWRVGKVCVKLVGGRGGGKGVKYD